MLKTRIITALVILPILLVALFALPNLVWALFTLGIVLAATWEWSRLSQMTGPVAIGYQLLTAAASVAVLLSYINGSVGGIAFEQFKWVGFSLAAIFWLLVVPVWLGRTWKSPSPALTGLVGWLVIFPTWLAFLSLHDLGPWVLLTFAAIVWVADIAAYFVGRRFGTRKLAPAISPGKTVQGAMGAIAGVALYFFLWRYLSSFAPVEANGWVRELLSHGWMLFAAFFVLSFFSILGDLFESWMKRCAGMKDSSNLLPGHGGILDRIDALTSTLPLAGLYMMLMAASKT